MHNRVHKYKIQLCERALANEPPSYPLSHHPNCSRFESHTFSLGRFRFCIGCYIGYPSAIFGLVLGTSLYLPSLVTLWHLFGCGLVAYLALLASLRKFSEFKYVKILQKISVGTGSGFLIVVGFFLFEVPLVIKFSFAALVLLGLLLPVRAVHLRKAINICVSCELKWIDPQCKA